MSDPKARKLPPAATGTADSYRSTPPADPSGGSSVDWGPDFGGTTGDQFGVQAALALTDAEAAYDPVTVTSELALTDMQASFDTPVTVPGTITELTYDAFVLRNPNAQVNDGPDNWTNPANAAARDGSEASRAGQALAATDANLRLNYADFTGGIETFTISLVRLLYDTRQTGTNLNNGGLHHEYRLDGGAWVSLQIFTADVDNNPTVYDITAAVGGAWAKLNALEVRVRAVLGAGTSLVTCFCDCVQAEVTAQKAVVP